MLFYVVWQGSLGRQHSARKHDLDFKNPRFCRTDTSYTTAPVQHTDTSATTAPVHHTNTSAIQTPVPPLHHTHTSATSAPYRHQCHYSTTQTPPAPLHHTVISTTTTAPQRVARLLQPGAPLQCTALHYLDLHCIARSQL